jgi:hypothetical protein
VTERQADPAAPATAAAPRPSRGWFRGINFARPRYTNVVILLGLLAFWAGVVLKMLT